MASDPYLGGVFMFAGNSGKIGVKKLGSGL
jgi:hypothetical protein